MANGLLPRTRKKATKQLWLVPIAVIIGFILTFMFHSSVIFAAQKNPLSSTNYLSNNSFYIYNKPGSVTFRPAGGVTQGSLPDNVKNSVHYDATVGKNAVRMSLPKNPTSQTMFGVVYENAASYRARELDIVETVNNFKYAYDDNYFGSHHYFDVSRKFAGGMMYFGVLRANINYQFLYHDNHQPVNFDVNNDSAYFTFDSLNPRPAKLPYHADDVTGEWVNYDTLNSKGKAETGWVTNPTYIGSYFSKAENGYVNGGKKGSPGFEDFIGGWNFEKYGIAYKLVVGQKSHSFRFGSGAGSAWFTQSTHPLGNPVTPKPDKITASKEVDKAEIHKQNEEIIYKIKGKLPHRENTYKYSDGKVRETNTDDYYKVTDTLPNDLTYTEAYTSVNSKRYAVTSSKGNTITSQFNKSFLNDHTGEDYEIVIRTKANKLPQPGENGWSQSPQKHGQYSINNIGKIEQKVYGKNDSTNTNKVTTKIKRYEGTVQHYDYDWQEKGNFGFKKDATNNSGFTKEGTFKSGKGNIKTQKVYGYEGDSTSVDILKDKTKDSHQAWKYIFAYGNQNSVKINFSGSSETPSFYLPYIVPRAKLETTIAKVDTDKQSNGLPFKMATTGEAYLYRELGNFDNGKVTANVKSNGNTIFTQTKNLKDIIGNSEHGKKVVEWSGILNTSKLANKAKGSNIPLVISFSFENPKSIQLDTTNESTKGYFASERVADAQSFDKSTSQYNAPQRTVKFHGIETPREIREELVLTQNRTAHAKTGYGMKNDLNLAYNGIPNDDYKLSDGATLNYVFPQQFADKNNYITYKDDSQNHKFKGKSMLADRFNQVNKQSTIKVDATGYNGKSGNTKLDTLTDFSKADQDKVKNIYNAVGSDMQDDKRISFSTNYEFYKREAIENSGNVIMHDNSEDPLAKTKDVYEKGDFRDAGKRFYTPYWLELGDYDTHFTKSNKSSSGKDRLGANWLNIDEKRPVNFYAHMYLSRGSHSEKDDELSLQPILSDYQTPHGFNSTDKAWLRAN